MKLTPEICNKGFKSFTYQFLTPRNVCRYLLFTYKAIDILDKYGNSGPEVRKPELEVQRPEPDTEKKEEVNPGQDQSNIVDAESKL